MTSLLKSSRQQPISGPLVILAALKDAQIEPTDDDGPSTVRVDVWARTPSTVSSYRLATAPYCDLTG